MNDLHKNHFYYGLVKHLLVNTASDLLVIKSTQTFHCLPIVFLLELQQF
jgi:hypothetical protein